MVELGEAELLELCCCRLRRGRVCWAPRARGLAPPVPSPTSPHLATPTSIHPIKTPAGRRLTWQTALGTADLKATFGGGTRKHEIQCSTYQVGIAEVGWLRWSGGGGEVGDGDVEWRWWEGAGGTHGVFNRDATEHALLAFAPTSLTPLLLALDVPQMAVLMLPNDAEAPLPDSRHRLSTTPPPPTQPQMAVLMLFNDAEALAYEEIEAATGIPEDDLKRVLQSLACVKVRRRPRSACAVSPHTACAPFLLVSPSLRKAVLRKEPMSKDTRQPTPHLP